MRLRPEVPNFDFGNRKGSTEGTCARCGSVVEFKLAFCPQCGASLTTSSSPIADAAHNSIPPNEVERARLAAAVARSDARECEAQPPGATCPRCRVIVIPGARNCPQCGNRIDESDAGAASLASSAPLAGSTARPPMGDSEPIGTDKPLLSKPLGRLVMLAQDGSVQRVIPLSGERVDIGRTTGEIQLPEDHFLSDRHARFTGRSEGFELADLSSINGIYLKLRDVASLSDGDMFLIGLQLLEFRTESPEMANITQIQAGGCSLFGSSTSPRYARLSERTNDGAPRSVFVIGREETILGREVGDIVFSGDPFMSRRHASLTRNPADGTFAIRDLGSSNGTFLRIRGRVKLEPGDHLRIGQHLFRYEMETP
jgi:pSer/pThr/pTyr-binding forkhead associated (FHA) protein/RNA polymerase subunit RPABC4/transcription elongation factor Spt4